MASIERTGRGRHTTLASVVVAFGVLAGLYGMHVAPDPGGCHGTSVSVAMPAAMAGDTHHDVRRDVGSPGVRAAVGKAGATCVPTLPRTFDWAAPLIAVFVATLGAAWVGLRPLPVARPARPPPRDLLLGLCISRT